MKYFLAGFLTDSAEKYIMRGSCTHALLLIALNLPETACN